MQFLVTDNQISNVLLILGRVPDSTVRGPTPARRDRSCSVEEQVEGVQAGAARRSPRAQVPVVYCHSGTTSRSQNPFMHKH